MREHQSASVAVLLGADVSSMPADTAIQYFSSSYVQARDKFLGAAQSANAELVAFENPAKGVEGECLFTDVALLGSASAPSVLVLCSGTHGVEGFCGSGIQTGLLRDGIADQLPADVRIVMIHALTRNWSHMRSACSL